MQERLEHVHPRKHSWRLFVNYFSNHMYNPIVLCHDILLVGHRDASILKRVVRLPEQVLPVILQALVKRGHDHDPDDRADQAADRRNIPGFEQHLFTVPAVKGHRHTVHPHAGAGIRRRGDIVAPVDHVAVVHSAMVHTSVHVRMLHPLKGQVSVVGCMPAGRVHHVPGVMIVGHLFLKPQGYDNAGRSFRCNGEPRNERNVRDKLRGHADFSAQTIRATSHRPISELYATFSVSTIAADVI